MSAPAFSWDEVRRDGAGKVVLLYRHARILREPFWPGVRDVLDVGGWGIFAERVLQEGRTCIILDKFTKDQQYPERVQMLPHRRGDVCNPGLFLPASFDLITCCETLEHVRDVPAALSSMYRWLRSGAHLVGTVPLPGFCHHAGEDGISILSEAELRGALSAAGYDRIRIEPTRSEGRDDEPPCSLYFVARKAAPP